MTRETINLKVDGQPTTAQGGETLLTVCHRLGKDIPTLCHHDALEPYAACRVCLVEIVSGAKAALVPSCQYPVSEGLEVRTDSPVVVSTRRLVLELLLARCPASQVVRDLAARYGVTSTPFVIEDPDETCILCGLCVRACEDRLGIGALGFSQRGIARQVGTPYREASDLCVGCLACVSVCPTGYARTHDEGSVRHMDTWRTKLPLETCKECGQPFVSERQLQQIRGKLPEHMPVEKVCAVCRRKQTVDKMKAKATPHPGAGRTACDKKK